MLNEKRLRLLVFLTVALIHIVLIFFLTFNLKIDSQAAGENARMMKLVDLSEIEPEPPPPPEEIQIPMVESIAETMIETDEIPDQVVVAPGTLIIAAPTWDDYLPQHKVSHPPRFNEKELLARLVYPPIALRSGIKGMVYLDLFIDNTGLVQRIVILKEEPKDRGFGEAAVNVFTGMRGIPALDENGNPVSSHIRWPVNFKIADNR